MGFIDGEKNRDYTSVRLLIILSGVAVPFAY